MVAEANTIATGEAFDFGEGFIVAHKISIVTLNNMSSQRFNIMASLVWLDFSALQQISVHFGLAEHWQRMDAAGDEVAGELAWWHLDMVAGMILERPTSPSAIPSPELVRGSRGH